MDCDALFSPRRTSGFLHCAFSGSGQTNNAGELARAENMMQRRALFFAQSPTEALLHDGILCANSMGDMAGTDGCAFGLGKAFCAGPKLVFRSQIVFGRDVTAVGGPDQIG